MTDAERHVRRSLDKVEDALSATPFDLGSCQRSFRDLRERVGRLLEERIPPTTLSGREWSDALLKTARADLRAAEALVEKDCPTALCMLLQMVFEKLAKAALARVDEQRFLACRRSHAVASRFVATLRLDPVHWRLHRQWKDVFSVVRMLEASHPAITKNGPHLEYPWEDRGRMALPEELPVVREFDDARNPRGVRVLRLARELCDRFDEFFQ